MSMTPFSRYLWIFCGVTLAQATTCQACRPTPIEIHRSRATFRCMARMWLTSSSCRISSAWLSDLTQIHRTLLRSMQAIKWSVSLPTATMEVCKETMQQRSTYRRSCSLHQRSSSHWPQELHGKQCPTPNKTNTLVWDVHQLHQELPHEACLVIDMKR